MMMIMRREEVQRFFKRNKQLNWSTAKFLPFRLRFLSINESFLLSLSLSWFWKNKNLSNKLQFLFIFFLSFHFLNRSVNHKILFLYLFLECNLNYSLHLLEKSKSQHIFFNFCFILFLFSPYLFFNSLTKISTDGIVTLMMIKIRVLLILLFLHLLLFNSNSYFFLLFLSPQHQLMLVFYSTHHHPIATGKEQNVKKCADKGKMSKNIRKQSELTCCNTRWLVWLADNNNNYT